MTGFNEREIELLGRLAKGQENLEKRMTEMEVTQKELVAAVGNAKFGLKALTYIGGITAIVLSVLTFWRNTPHGN